MNQRVLFEQREPAKAILITHFRVAFRLCFKVSPSAKPFIRKFVLFPCKFWFIYM